MSAGGGADGRHGSRGKLAGRNSQSLQQRLKQRLGWLSQTSSRRRCPRRRLNLRGRSAGSSPGSAAAAAFNDHGKTHAKEHEKKSAFPDEDELQYLLQKLSNHSLEMQHVAKDTESLSSCTSGLSFEFFVTHFLLSGINRSSSFIAVVALCSHVSAVFVTAFTICGISIKENNVCIYSCRRQLCFLHSLHGYADFQLQRRT